LGTVKRVVDLGLDRYRVLGSVTVNEREREVGAPRLNPLFPVDLPCDVMRGGPRQRQGSEDGVLDA
jgi:hypothetical protein